MRDMGIIVSVFGQLIYISFHFIRVCGGSRISQTEGGRAQPQSWDTKELFRPMFPKNCKEMKEIGPGAPTPNLSMRVSISVNIVMLLLEEYVHCATKHKYC